MDEYNPGAAPSVARLLLELRGRATVDVKPVGKALQVRPQGATGVAVFIHAGGVDVAVEPERANELALSMPGAYVRDPDDPNTVVTLDADLIDENYDTLLEAAVQAVDLRKTTVKPVKATRARSTSTAAPKAPKAAKATKTTATKRASAPEIERPRCPKCRQYELLASGECPSGYC
jgi:cell division septation protein DedD